MGLDVTVAVGTFGDSCWLDLALDRAIPSAADQARVAHSHRQNLADARNTALAQVETEWVVFLDADDELEPGYIDAMAAGTADVRGPLVRYMVNGYERNLWRPRVFGHEHDCEAECLEDGNWLVIGSAVRADLVREAGGFRDFAWSEDWDLWCRCWKLGATFELLRDAVYRAHVRPDSRNRGQTQEAKAAAHAAIYEANFGEAVEAW